MLKAHSLLYAIYVCLIVAVMCAALLSYSGLYGRLNSYYNLQEELYLNNMSTVNFALGNKMIATEIPDDASGIKASFTTKPYGMLTLLLSVSSVRNDSVVSALFAGHYAAKSEALHLAGFSLPLSYSGNVTIKGDCVLPTASIARSYADNNPSNLTLSGTLTASTAALPEIDPKFKQIFAGDTGLKTTWANLEKNDESIYFNSFENETLQIDAGTVVEGKTIKGNFILHAMDSILIRKNAILEDVIIIAPKITFEPGFSGTVQAFATANITAESIKLDYPSVLCVYNASDKKASILVGKKSSIKGAIVLFGNAPRFTEQNMVSIDEGGLITGDVYCSGKLELKSDVYGSVYTNRFFYTTPSSTYENRITNLIINPYKRPAHFVPFPLFNDKKTGCGIAKKVR